VSRHYRRARTRRIALGNEPHLSNLGPHRPRATR
jgi:hypothetical protein